MAVIVEEISIASIVRKKPSEIKKCSEKVIENTMQYIITHLKISLVINLMPENCGMYLSSK